MKYTKRQQMLDLGYLPLVIDDGLEVKPVNWGVNGEEGKHLELDIFAENVKGKKVHQHMIFINKDKFMEILKIAKKHFKLK
jgi:hypothetical protein